MFETPESNVKSMQKGAWLFYAYKKQYLHLTSNNLKSSKKIQRETSQRIVYLYNLYKQVNFSPHAEIRRVKEYFKRHFQIGSQRHSNHFSL